MAAQLMVIGSGAIATALIQRLPPEIKVVTIITSPRSATKVAKQYPHIEVVTSVDAVTQQPDFVIECAGHSALKAHAEAILKRGWRLGIISTGALTDSSFYDRLQPYRQQWQIISGAIAGLDGLAAASESASLTQPIQVTYVATKPSRSWLGTPAETIIKLDQLTQRTVFFTGNAREAAQQFPQNANVAATIALMGVGFEATQVQLSADPNTTQNQHQIQIEGSFGKMSFEIQGIPLPDNPKTSYLTVLSVLHTCKVALAKQITSLK